MGVFCNAVLVIVPVFLLLYYTTPKHQTSQGIRCWPWSGRRRRRSDTSRRPPYRRAALGDSSPALGDSLYSVATCDSRLQQWAAAAKHFAAAQEIYAAVYGAERRWTPGRMEEAEKMGGGR